MSRVPPSSLSVMKITIKKMISAQEHVTVVPQYPNAKCPSFTVDITFYSHLGSHQGLGLWKVVGIPSCADPAACQLISAGGACTDTSTISAGLKVVQCSPLENRGGRFIVVVKVWSVIVTNNSDKIFIADAVIDLRVQVSRVAQ